MLHPMRWVTSFKFPAKATKFSLLFAATAGVAAFSFPDDSSHISNHIWSPFFVLRRSSYTFFTVQLSLSLFHPFIQLIPSFMLLFIFWQIALTVFDYKYSLHGLAKDSDDYRRLISEVLCRICAPFSFFLSVYICCTETRNRNENGNGCL